MWRRNAVATPSSRAASTRKVSSPAWKTSVAGGDQAEPPDQAGSGGHQGQRRDVAAEGGPAERPAEAPGDQCRRTDDAGGLAHRHEAQQHDEIGLEAGGVGGVHAADRGPPRRRPRPACRRAPPAASAAPSRGGGCRNGEIGHRARSGVTPEPSAASRPRPARPEAARCATPTIASAAPSPPRREPGHNRSPARPYPVVRPALAAGPRRHLDSARLLRYLPRSPIDDARAPPCPATPSPPSSSPARCSWKISTAR